MVLEIDNISARQILDSRGNPTVEAEVVLIDGTKASASVPSALNDGFFLKSYCAGIYKVLNDSPIVTVRQPDRMVCIYRLYGLHLKSV